MKSGETRLESPVRAVNTRAAMADIYRNGLKVHQEISAANASPYKVNDRQELISSSVFHLIQHMQDVPVLVVPTIETRLDGVSIFEQGSRWGSILPAFWSFMLAARARGLGTAWTTLHLVYEREVAEVLGIPWERFTNHARVTDAHLLALALHRKGALATFDRGIANLLPVGAPADAVVIVV